MCGRVHAAGKGKHLRCSRWPWLAWLSLYINRSGEDHEYSDTGDSLSGLCGRELFGGTAGGVVVEGLGDTTQRLGMVEDTRRGTSSQAVIKRRRPRGAAGRSQWPCLRGYDLYSLASLNKSTYTREPKEEDS